MAINFPNSPSSNETYSENDTSWKWDGTSWNRLTGLVGTESSTLSGVGATQFARRDVNNVITGITTLSTSGVGNTTLNVEGDSRFGSNIKVIGVSTFSGNVNVSGVNITLGDSSGASDDRIVLGSGSNFNIYHDGSHSWIDSNEGDLVLKTTNDDIVLQSYDDIHMYVQGSSGSGAEKAIFAYGNAGVELYYNNTKRVETTNTGAVVTGILTATDFSGAAGGAADFPNGLTGTNATFSGNVSIGGVLTYEDVKNVDSIGIITARTDIKVGSAVTLTSAGAGFYAGIVTASAFKLTDGSNVGGTDSDAQGNTLGGTNAGDSFSGTSALKNTLFGYDAGTAITTSDENTVLGHSALKTNTAEGGNTAIGFESLKVSTSVYNTAVGKGALTAENGTEGYNTAVGVNAGMQVNAGGNNVMLGYTAGNNIEGGDYNIILGAWSRASSAGVNNECTIGGNQSARTIRSFRVPGIGLTITNVSATVPTSGSQFDLTGNANFVGVVTATSFSGSGANLTSLPAQATIANNADNRVITGGSGVNLNGEANLKFDGTKLDIDSSAQNVLQLNSTHSDGPNIALERSGSALGYFGSAAANTSGTATDLALRAQGNLVLATNGGNERLRITSDGKYYFTGTGGGSGSRGLEIDTESVGAADEGVILNARASGVTGRIKFQTNSKTAMTIDGDGKNVGIGTDDPDNLLHLAGTNTTAWPFTADVSGTYAYTPYPHELQIQNHARDVTGSFAGIYFHSGAAADGSKMAAARIAAVDSGDYNSDLVFGTRNTNFRERLRITSAGRIGINETSPDTDLHIKNTNPAIIIEGTNNSGRQHKIWSSGSNSESLQFTSGNLYYNGDTHHFRAANESTDYLLIDSSGHVTPGALGTQNFGSTSKGWGNVYIADDKQLTLGNDSNLYIKHSNGHANNFVVSSVGDIEHHMALSKKIIKGFNNSNTPYVNLYQNNNIRLTTTSTGITVTGEVAATQDYPNYRPRVDWNFAAVKKLDPRITYQRTGPASYVDENGFIKFVGDNTPRFDHDPITGESRGLLIEPSRINLFASSDAAHSAWIKQSATRTANTTDTKDPAGTYTACKLMSAASANSGSQIYDGMSHGSGGVQSCWAKKGTHNVLGIYDYSGGTGIRAWYDLNTGEHRCEGGSKVAAGVQSEGNDNNDSWMIEYPNGWYRCIYYEAANMTYAHFRICDFDSDGEASSSSNSIYLWGLQAEGSGATYATSHIPCNTGFMPGTVARGADFAYLDGTVGTEFDDIYDPLQGTFVLDWFNDPNGNFNDGYVFTVDDGTGNNRIAAVNSNGYQVTAVASGTSQGTRDLGSINSGKNKIAFTYKHNDQATSLNGSDASVDTSSAVPSFTGSKYWWFGLRQGQYDHLGGYISRIMYYPRRLPNNQLKTLSS